ncbi:MAG: hypothetical protein VW876_11935 [Deltaproteobacteria bacterium]
MNNDGVLRETLVYVPESYEGTEAVPLLLNFHGYGGFAANHLLTADFRQLAEVQTFLLAYPQGSTIRNQQKYGGRLWIHRGVN